MIRKKCVFSRHLKLARVPQVLIKLGKVFHRDAAATVNEPSPSLGTSEHHLQTVTAGRALCSCRLIWAHEFTQIHWHSVVHGFVCKYQYLEIDMPREVLVTCKGPGIVATWMTQNQAAAELCICCRYTMLTTDVPVALTTRSFVGLGKKNG